MTEHFEIVEHEGNDPRYNMPYVPAIKVHAGKTVYVSGVTAAPVYHSHPHVPAEFDSIPADPAEQARRTMEHLRLAQEDHFSSCVRLLERVGGRG